MAFASVTCIRVKMMVRTRMEEGERPVGTSINQTVDKKNRTLSVAEDSGVILLF